jgi:hypothetical protein
VCLTDRHDLTNWRADLNRLMYCDMIDGSDMTNLADLTDRSDLIRLIVLV